MLASAAMDETAEGDAGDGSYYEFAGDPGELVTAAFGPPATHAAAHFFNARDADIAWGDAGGWGAAAGATSSVHFRAGALPTPRALLFDVAGGFGRAGRHGGLGVTDDPDAVNSSLPAWDGGVATFAAQRIGDTAYSRHLAALGAPGYEPPARSDFALDASASWADYARTYFHPRSLVAAPLDPAGLSATGAAEMWSAASYSDWADDAFDALRRLAEECGRMQGIQVLCTAGGWGGLAAGFAERAADEIGRNDIVALPIDCAPLAEVGGRTVHDLTAAQPFRAVEVIKTAQMLYEPCSLVLPVTLPRALAPRSWSRHASKLDLSLPYHTGFLVASALDTIGLPWRTPGRGLREAIDGVRAMPGARIAGLASAWPLPLYDTGDFAGIRRGLSELMGVQYDASGRAAPSSSPSTMLDLLRGQPGASAAAFLFLPGSSSPPAVHPDVSHRLVLRGLPASHAAASADLLQGAWGVPPLSTDIFSAPDPATQPDSAPDIFSPSISDRGWASGSPRTEHAASFPHATRIYSSASIGAWMRGEAAAAGRERRAAKEADGAWEEVREAWDAVAGVYEDMEA
ncbi:hypothetical protein DFJ74DRAFT_766203 [Hyaloraphidium curvatum]|nr:hypothetical protein DFJ74DRAFT_766203 [Hyaloraphidium curvatum]